ncbi:hypothetical protein MSPP1_003144 [Malassezia sp. CBS 17886]|nr:hypothetical protein MSPP1_003144 [Malassezia sp. CBS 17886]
MRARALQTGARVCTPRVPHARLEAAIDALGGLVVPETAWAQRLRAARAALSAARVPPRRVAIVGAAAGGTRELVDALLLEPADAAAAAALRGAAGRGGVSTFRYGSADTAGMPPHTHALPLAWMREANVEIVEMLDPSFSASARSVLYGCDAVHFVCDVEALQRGSESDPTLQLAAYFARKPYTAVLVNMRADAASTPVLPAVEAVRDAVSSLDTRVLAGLAEHWAPSRDADVVAPGVRMVSSAAAADAKARFEEMPMGTFATQLRASRVTALFKAVTTQDAADARDARAAFATFAALDEVSSAEHAEAMLLRAAAGHGDVLRETADADMAHTAAALYPSTGDAQRTGSDVRAGDSSASVMGALADTRHQVEQTLAERFAWWRLPWRIDELSSALRYAAGRSFGTEQTLRLAYEAGRLRGAAAAALRVVEHSLDDLVRREDRERAARLDRDTVADAYPSLASPTLRNELKNYSDAHVGAFVTPDCLSEPLTIRRQQLLASDGPIDALTGTAQRCVRNGALGLAGAYTAAGYGALGGLRHIAADRVRTGEQVAVAVDVAGVNADPVGAAADAVGAGADQVGTAAVVSAPATSFSSLLDAALHEPLFTLTPGTAGGTALFATAAAAWYVQGSWSRGKRKFWANWDRIVDAAERDGKSDAERLLLNTVYGAPLLTAEALRAVALVRATEQKDRIARLDRVRTTLEVGEGAGEGSGGEERAAGGAA